MSQTKIYVHPKFFTYHGLEEKAGNSHYICINCPKRIKTNGKLKTISMSDISRQNLHTFIVQTSWSVFFIQSCLYTWRANAFKRNSRRRFRHCSSLSKQKTSYNSRFTYISIKKATKTCHSIAGRIWWCWIKLHCR